MSSLVKINYTWSQPTGIVVHPPQPYLPNSYWLDGSVIRMIFPPKLIDEILSNPKDVLYDSQSKDIMDVWNIHNILEELNTIVENGENPDRLLGNLIRFYNISSDYLDTRHSCGRYAAEVNLQIPVEEFHGRLFALIVKTRTFFIQNPESLKEQDWVKFIQFIASIYRDWEIIKQQITNFIKEIDIASCTTL